MIRKQESKIMQSPLTGTYYYVDKYKELGKGHFEALNKREATKEEIEQYLEEVKKHDN